MSIDNATPEEWDQAIDMLAINNQVGGNHYKGNGIQPLSIFTQMVCHGRWVSVETYYRDKVDKVEDLLKAKHYIDLELQLVHGVDGEG